MGFGISGEESLDYRPCRYDGSALDFRGPRREIDGGHLAVLGGTESYGKFVPQPWPDLLEASLAQPVANLALRGGGLDAVLGDAAVLAICRSARATVIELGGVANLSNRFYSVHPRRNDRVVRASARLTAICPDLDLTGCHFTRHLLQELARLAPEALQTVLDELASVWLRRMERLIRSLGGPVVLLWLSDRAPARRGERAFAVRQRGGGQMVDAAMIARLRPQVSAVVEIVADAEELHGGYRDMVFPDLQALAAAEMLGPAVHRRVARELAGVLPGLLRPAAVAGVPPRGL